MIDYRKIMVLALRMLIVVTLWGGIHGATSNNNGTVTTNWYKMPPVGLSGKSYTRENGGKIRDSFRNLSEVGNRSLLKTVSPALELAFGDTGDKTFLEMKTIKHSISDLSGLSSFIKLSPGEILSCNAIQEGPKMYFPTCPGDVVVVTIAGSMKMTCNEIEKRVFYGPVTIKSGTCQHSLDFDMSCEGKEALSIKTSSCPGTAYKTAFAVLAVMFVVSTSVLFLMLVWLIGINRGVLIRGTKVDLNRKGCYYEANYNEFINSEGKRVLVPQGVASEVNMESRTLRKHWTVLLLLFLTCRTPTANSYELVETYDSTVLKYNYRIIMQDSEIIDFGPGSIKREAVIYTSNLVPMFKTSKWNLKVKEEYFCQWFKCEAIGVCGLGILPFIKIGMSAQEIFNFDHPSRAYYTCQKLTGYCAFGNGTSILIIAVGCLILQRR